MDELDSRLAAVFRAVFPGLHASAVADATKDSIADWDSVATVTLCTLIEEEFGIELDLEEAGEWTSFGQVRAALEGRLVG